MDKDLVEDILMYYPGEIVNVNDHRMHVYSEGHGDVTLVFMSGNQTCAPYFDFKPLFSKLSGEYRIAIAERAGFGFSEIAGVPRDIDTILFETRTALQMANIEPPYVLFPHSIAGIEALYWVQCFPHEVKAIIGLDAAFPSYYETMGDFLKGQAVWQKRIAPKISDKFKILIPFVSNFLPPIKYKILNNEDARLCKALFFHRILTSNMISEWETVEENSKKINRELLKDVPMLLYVTPGKEMGLIKGYWEKLVREYTEGLNAETVFVKASHYVHDMIPDRISNESKIFINKILAGSVAAADT